MDGLGIIIFFGIQEVAIISYIGWESKTYFRIGNTMLVLLVLISILILFVQMVIEKHTSEVVCKGEQGQT